MILSVEKSVYTKKNIKRILRPVLVSKKWIKTVETNKNFEKQVMKVGSQDIFYNKLDMRCYNFCLKCKYNFASV